MVLKYKLISLLNFIVICAMNIPAANAEEIICTSTTCSGGNGQNTVINEKNYFTTIKSELNNVINEDKITIKKENKFSQPKNIKVFLSGATKDKKINTDINLSSESSIYNSSHVDLIGDYFNNLNINLNGYSGDFAKSASQVCAEKINSGEYGSLIKADFDSRRIISPELPKDKCSYADLAFIQNKMFQCDEGYQEILSTNPTVDVKRFKGKFKCTGVSMHDVCLAPMVEVSCKWRLKYAGLFPEETANYLFEDEMASTVIKMTVSGSHFFTYNGVNYPQPYVVILKSGRVFIQDKTNLINGKIYKSYSEVIPANVLSYLGINRNLKNTITGLNYWVKPDGVIIDSPVGQYSSDENEIIEKKFIIKEDEFLYKKEIGMVPYLCDNLTKGTDDDYLKLPQNIIENSTFSKNDNAWEKSNSGAYWKELRIKLDSKSSPFDLIVSNGESYFLYDCSTYYFKNLTINTGGVIYIPNYCLNRIVVTGKFTNNGSIIGKNDSLGKANYSVVMSDGSVYNVENPQVSGGNGGTGGSGWVGGAGGGYSYYGNGGGGGGGAGDASKGGDDRGSGGTSSNLYSGGTGGCGGDGGPCGAGGGTEYSIIGGDAGSGGRWGGGGGGGGGGFRGRDGTTLYIKAKEISGNGVIDIRGTNGGNGGVGSVD